MILSSHFLLLQTCLGDEEVHAISAMLRENETIADLNLSGNMVSDEGCRALASVLSGPSSLERIDLRKNRITTKGIKLIVEALERSARVRHVHVHAGGKIEAFGQEIKDGDSSTGKQPNLVCKVDVRDNSKPEDSQIFREDLFGLPITVSDDDSSKVKKGSKPGKREEVRRMFLNHLISHTQLEYDLTLSSQKNTKTRPKSNSSK